MKENKVLWNIFYNFVENENYRRMKKKLHQ